MIKFGRLLNSMLRQFGVKMIRSDAIYWNADCIPYGCSLARDIERLSETHAVKLIVDVGANIGIFASDMLRVFPSASIWCFEPVPSTFTQLSKNVTSMPSIHPFNLGLADEDGSREMMITQISETNTLVNNSLYTRYFPESNVQHKDAISVCLRSLDSLCREYKIETVDLLKIDTEGSDISVLRGATQLLSDKRIRFIYIEYYRPNEVNGYVGGGLHELHVSWRLITTLT